LIANTKDVATAIEINKLFEVVIAPEYDAEAIEILQEKQIILIQNETYHKNKLDLV
jgi:phosphoribosylaminoimidazolecarboxamide formyltransferase/IMP cyclohydrolase